MAHLLCVLPGLQLMFQKNSDVKKFDFKNMRTLMLVPEMQLISVKYGKHANLINLKQHRPLPLRGHTQYAVPKLVTTSISS